MKSFSVIYILTGILVFGLAGASSADLTVTPNTDANALVDEILGPGVTVVPGTAALIGGSGGNASAGIFAGGDAPPAGKAGIGIGAGIILSSGKVADAVGPNDNGPIVEILGGLGTADDKSTNLGLAGDADLTSLAGFPTFDATVLTFQFTTEFKGHLNFRFVFASEEYLDYVNTSFNDVFAFYLDGENLALVPEPGPATPISVNTINPITNSGYYKNNINNALGLPGVNSVDVEYDGLTTVLTAQKLDLAPGTHTMKLAVADGSDDILDAAVFIQGGSFQIAEVEVPVDVRPTSCPNPLNFKEKGVLPVAILGTADLDVTQIDPASVRLQGSVAPIRWSLADVATPYEPFVGKDGCSTCTTAGPDGFVDLVFKFDAQAVVQALGNAWNDGDCVILNLSGNLQAPNEGVPIIGEDWVVLRIKK